MYPASKRFAFVSMWMFSWLGCAPNAAQQAEFIDRAPYIATTSSYVAITNLNSNIDGMRSALARTGSFGAGSRLVDMLLMRARYTGSYSDFDEASALAEMFVEQSSLPQALLLRANVRSTVHDFEGAANDLLEAEQISGVDTSGPRSTIFLARGNALPEVLTVRTLALERGPSFKTHTDMAAILAALGRFEEADAHFVEALEMYRDVSPFPVAWVYFQRGVMWSEQAGRPDIGRQLYEKAVHLLPQYVVANVHLAELERLDGDIEQAVERIERIYERTEDPEPAGMLAGLLVDRDPGRANQLAEHAQEVYGYLLDRYPLAFLDHASEFFGGPGGKPARAVELALQNLDHRQNPRAYIVALQAALANHQPALACELARDAQSLGKHNVNLASLSATVLLGC